MYSFTYTHSYLLIHVFISYTHSHIHSLILIHVYSFINSFKYTHSYIHLRILIHIFIYLYSFIFTLSRIHFIYSFTYSCPSMHLFYLEIGIIPIGSSKTKLWHFMPTRKFTDYTRDNLYYSFFRGSNFMFDTVSF